MKTSEKRNITLALPKDLLRKIKVLAAQRDTSVSALVIRLLEDVVRRESDYELALHEELDAMRKGLLRVGKITWTRDELHER